MNVLVILLFVLAVVLCGLAGFGDGGVRRHLLGFGCAAGWLALLLTNLHL